MSDLTITIKASSWARVTKELDEAREALAVATTSCVDAQQELRTARNLADSAMWEADRLRSKLCRVGEK